MKNTYTAAFSVLASFLALAGLYASWNGVQESALTRKLTWSQRSLTLLPNEGFAADENAADAEERLRKSIIPFWDTGEAMVSTPHQYVKYGSGYKTRAVINFEKGEVIIETVDQSDPVGALKTHAVETLLTPAANDVDLYSDKISSKDKEPFLYGQLEDKHGQTMHFGARVGNFVDEEMKKGLHTREIMVNGLPKTVRSIHLAMKDNHMLQRAKKYIPAMRENARKFGLPLRLLLAVAHVESAFNPFAVSSASAYGIMQVVPSSAGMEVHSFLGKKSGKPNRSFLFNFENNIRYGAAYLHILHTKYFSGIKNAVSRELCSIAAYNGGPGAVLKAFGKTAEESCAAINRLSPQALFDKLKRIMPSQETRKYVEKVVRAMKNYKEIA